MICDTCDKINRICLPSTTEEKAIIEFCKKINKVMNNDDILLNSKEQIIKFLKEHETITNDLSNIGTQTGDKCQSTEKKENESEKEKREFNELIQAAKNSLKILNYLLNKHKNKRAYKFYILIYKSVSDQIKDKLIEKIVDDNNHRFKDDKNRELISTINQNKEISESLAREARGMAVKNICDSINKNDLVFDPKTFDIIEKLKKVPEEIGKSNETRHGNYYTRLLQSYDECLELMIRKHRHIRGKIWVNNYNQIINNAVKAYNKAVEKEDTTLSK